MNNRVNYQQKLVQEYTSANEKGKVAIVTGANSGIGLEATVMLAKRGMAVIMACRNLNKAEAARKYILQKTPDANISIKHLDLSSQLSVQEFSEEFISEYRHLNLLVNNGGVMTGPHRLTEDGFEMLIGTNHFGHFALTARLMGKLLETSKSRVVTVSSIAHFKGQIKFDDINSNKVYSRKEAYRQSKLANLLFAYELDRRLKEAGSDVISVAVHPGVTSTKIVKLPKLIDMLKDAVLMNPVKGALPTMMGAVSYEVAGGEFIGPDGYGQIFGFPAIQKSGEHSYNKELWARLWTLSEEMTGIKFKI